MKRIGFFMILLASSSALAAGGHGEGVPWKTIFWQVFNLTILFSGIIYLVAKPLRDFFAQRRAEYLETEKKSQSARKAAELQFSEVQQKLTHLEATREESYARAEGEAADMKKQLVRDANDLAVRIKAEAEATVRMEVLRAQLELRSEFVRESVQTARTVLQKDIGSQDHQRLQDQFVNQLQAGAQ